MQVELRDPTQSRQQRLTWIGQKLGPNLLDDAMSHPGTTLTERVQARRDRRASERLAKDQLVEELATLDDYTPLPIALTEFAESYLAESDSSLRGAA